MSDEKLDELLRTLMEELEAIGQMHDEIYDTAVREAMFNAVRRGFLEPEAGFELPEKLEAFSEEADAGIREALKKYIDGANARAAELGVQDPNERLAAFQNGDVCTSGEEQYPDDFFGWAESIE